MDMGKLAAIASDSSMVDRTGSLDHRVTESDIEGLFQAFLGREVGNADYIRHLVDKGCTVRNLIKSLRNPRNSPSSIEPSPPSFMPGTW